MARSSVRSSLSLARLRARKLVRVLRRSSYRSALRKGVLAATDHADAGLGRDVAAFGTVFDVGASRGQFATFARQTWPQARLVCFEPLAEVAARIDGVVDGPLEVHVAALGSEPATLTINVSGRDDSSSLLPIGRQADEFPGTAVAATREVPVRTLAEHLEGDLAGPVLLKIDVQGYELEVLRGAGDALKHVDEVFCECSFVELYTGQPLAGAVIAYLDSHGLSLAGVTGTSTAADGRQLQADLLFRRT